MITGNSGDISANKIITQLLDADEATLGKITSESAFIKQIYGVNGTFTGNVIANKILAKNQYRIYGEDYDENYGENGFPSLDSGVVCIRAGGSDKRYRELTFGLDGTLPGSSLYTTPVSYTHLDVYKRQDQY